MVTAHTVVQPHQDCPTTDGADIKFDDALLAHAEAATDDTFVEHLDQFIHRGSVGSAGIRLALALRGLTGRWFLGACAKG